MNHTLSPSLQNTRTRSYMIRPPTRYELKFPGSDFIRNVSDGTNGHKLMDGTLVAVPPPLPSSSGQGGGGGRGGGNGVGGRGGGRSSGSGGSVGWRSLFVRRFLAERRVRGKMYQHNGREAKPKW